MIITCNPSSRLILCRNNQRQSAAISAITSHPLSAHWSQTQSTAGQLYMERKGASLLLMLLLQLVVLVLVLVRELLRLKE